MSRPLLFAFLLFFFFADVVCGQYYGYGLGYGYPYGMMGGYGMGGYGGYGGYGMYGDYSYNQPMIVRRVIYTMPGMYSGGFYPGLYGTKMATAKN
ncbi:hypothetical protein QR680_005333 [Steinernema hermaphroditum]|uniref:Uncharacterized protein n=1 Tax=Steinernema hermaphroditum TaxID=289476 RepID=A0AA39LUM9_9BILA|nr:hypothetical protein QR680_005333 [Steinernema hermaphroditum]